MGLQFRDYGIKMVNTVFEKNIRIPLKKILGPPLAEKGDIIKSCPRVPKLWILILRG
jgi:hypothetical protein